MTGIAGIAGPSEADVTSKLDAMLDTMQVRGSIRRTMSVKGNDGVLGIGLCVHSKGQSLAEQPEKNSTVFDGTLPSSLELDEIGGLPNEQSFSELLGTPGSFAGLSISRGRLIAVRDVLGQKPLYYGLDQNGTVAFASLRNALASVRIPAPTAVPPGQLIASSCGNPSILEDKSLKRPKESKVNEHEASTKIKALLTDSLSYEVPEDLALAFSGGIDSALVAQAARENGLGPELITVGMKGQAELKHANEISKHLHLDITLKELSQSEILDALPTVVRTVESYDPILVGVSVPLFFACEVAQEMGMDCLLAGQLSDELFAGYGRFDDLAKEKDAQMAREEVWRSVLAASSTDFEPGDKLAVSHRLELRCPFAHLPLAEYALSIPISLKLKLVGSKVVRKYILRRVASDWKLPDSVVNRPKKAVQYSSGVQRVLLKEAKRRGMTLGRMLASASRYEV